MQINLCLFVCLFVCLFDLVIPISEGLSSLGPARILPPRPRRKEEEGGGAPTRQVVKARKAARQMAAATAAAAAEAAEEAGSLQILSNVSAIAVLVRGLLIPHVIRSGVFSCLTRCQTFYLFVIVCLLYRWL